MIEFWAADEPALAVFKGMLTQRRTGMGGVNGLYYCVVPMVMKMSGGKGKRRLREVFQDIR
ncbi:hypothetical protein BVL52_11285 [Pseudomonas oryzihabitans]|uniref:Uncharacterized protein n=1 Tax=Pseudomonas oryzihabitans TaxID=47885 RepID=A0ABX3IRU7_9PSED|nr:hypothetical protein BVL52_11285 [Pseudomonas psychrotolerans]